MSPDLTFSLRQSSGKVEADMGEGVVSISEVKMVKGMMGKYKSTRDFIMRGLPDRDRRYYSTLTSAIPVGTKM